MAFFLDSIALEIGRAIVLFVFLSLVGWTARSIIRIWLPVMKSRNKIL